MAGKRATRGQLEDTLRRVCVARDVPYGPEGGPDGTGGDGWWLVRWAPGDRVRWRVESTAGAPPLGHEWRDAREMLACLEMVAHVLEVSER